MVHVIVYFRDAAWELEPNAFQDLMHIVSSCHAETCICPFGRDVNRMDRYSSCIHAEEMFRVCIETNSSLNSAVTGYPNA